MRSGMEWTPRSSLQPWLQYCRVCKSLGEQRQCQHGQGEKSLVWAGFPGLSKGLWHLAEWSGCCAVPVLCVSVGMAPSIACCLWKSPGREGILCSWVGAGECPAASAVQHCPNSVQPCPPVCPVPDLCSWTGTVLMSGYWETISELGKRCTSTAMSAVTARCGYGWERITQRHRPRFPHVEGVVPPQCFSPPSCPFTAGLLPLLCQKSVLVTEKSTVSLWCLQAAWQDWLCPCCGAMRGCDTLVPASGNAPCSHRAQISRISF